MFTASAANAGFALDFGASDAVDGVNRCVIPAGHNFAGETVEVIHDTDGATLPSPTVADSIAVGAGSAALLDFSFTGVNGSQYWGLQVPTSAAEVFQLGEFWLGTRKTLTYPGGARVEPGFDAEYEHDVAEASYGGRTASLELSPPRKRFTLLGQRVDPSHADFATLDEVIRLGRSRPFWYWPPDSLDPGPYLVRLSRAARRRNDSRVPQSAIRYRVELEMLEEIT